MTYELTWCPQLGLFGLSDPFGGHKSLTEEELRKSFGDNVVLNQWADFAKQHPNVRCSYSMLPPAEERWNDGDDNGSSSYGTGVPGQNLSCFV